MYISKIYLLFSAEILLILLAACVTLIIYIIKKPATAKNNDLETEPDDSAKPSYGDYLDREILRNESRAEQQSRIEKEDAAENAESQMPVNDTQSQLLQLREMFLITERSSAEHADNENTFWDTLYSGLNDIYRQFKTIETEVAINTEQSYITTKNTSEKVFYIETQGKKVDSEVNRLKDIIYDQDSTLNSLKHALDGASSHISDDNKEFNTLKNELTKFEQQLNDSKMCMEVLEMENERLQSEIDNLEHQIEGQTEISAGNSTAISDNMNQLKENLSSQEQQINILNETIDSLQLNTTETENLKTTLQSFTRGSKEMMGCITILEDENDNLHRQIEDLKSQQESTVTDSDASSDELSIKVKSLEKEIIKKDVAYAKLQDEYSSIEKEYMSMYEQIHGDDNT